MKAVLKNRATGQNSTLKNNFPAAFIYKPENSKLYLSEED